MNRTVGESGRARLELGDDMADAGVRLLGEIEIAAAIGEGTGLIHGTWAFSDR